MTCNQIAHRFAIKHAPKFFVPPATPTQVQLSTTNIFVHLEVETSHLALLRVIMTLQPSLIDFIQPILELQETISQLKMIRQVFDMITPAMNNPEVLDHIRVIRDHLTHAIALYETFLELSVELLYESLRHYNERHWSIPPVRGQRH